LLLGELESYAADLGRRRRVVALDKIDLLTADEIESVRATLAVQEPVVPISGATRQGLQDLVWRISEAIEAARAEEHPGAVSPSED